MHRPTPHRPAIRRRRFTAAAALSLILFALLPTAFAEFNQTAAAPAPPPITLFAAGSPDRLWLVQSAAADQFSIAFHDPATPAGTFYVADPASLRGSPKAAAAYGRTLYLLYTDLSVQALTLEQPLPSTPWSLDSLQLPPLPQPAGALAGWVAGSRGPVALLKLYQPATPPAASTGAGTPDKPAAPAPLAPRWQLMALELGEWQPLPWPAELASLNTTPKLVMLNGQTAQIGLLVRSDDGESADFYTLHREHWTHERYDLPLSPAAQPVGLVDHNHPGETPVANLFVVEPAPADGALGVWWLRDGRATRSTRPADSLGVVLPGTAWWALPGADRIDALVAYAPGDLAWAQRLVTQGRTVAPVPVKVVEQPNPVADPITLTFVAAIVVGMIFMFVTARRETAQRIPQLPDDVVPAGLTRAAAAVVDFAPGVAIAALLLGVENPVEILQHWPGPASDWEAIRPAVLAIAIHVAHTSLSELFTGSTLGKLLLGCRVVNLTGGPPNVWQVLVRNFFKAVELFAPPLLILALINPSRQRLGDMVAGTVVVAPKPPQDLHDPLDDFDDDDAP